MKLYISDLHFYHENVIALDKRNFCDVKDMNAYMISQWNSKIKGGDQIYVLGDMFVTKEAKEVNFILNRLNGKIFLVEGNHDCVWLKKEGVNLNRFEWIKPYAEITDGNSNVILSHYPTFCYNHQYLQKSDGSPKTFMLYGHVHNTHDEVLVNQFQILTQKTELLGSTGTRKINCNMINCFCGFSDYKPLSLKEWIETDSIRRKNLKIPADQKIADEM